MLAGFDGDDDLFDVVGFDHPAQVFHAAEQRKLGGQLRRFLALAVHEAEEAVAELLGGGMDLPVKIQRRLAPADDEGIESHLPGFDPPAGPRQEHHPPEARQREVRQKERDGVLVVVVDVVSVIVQQHDEEKDDDAQQRDQKGLGQHAQPAQPVDVAVLVEDGVGQYPAEGDEEAAPGVGGVLEKGGRGHVLTLLPGA